MSKVISRKFTTILAGLVIQRATDPLRYPKTAAKEESTGFPKSASEL